MFENRRSQLRNDSRSKSATLEIHNSLIQYFVSMSEGKDIPILKAIYLSELINIERFTRISGCLKDSRWFICTRKQIIDKYKVSESNLRLYDKLFIELGLIEKKRERALTDPFNYYSLNHEMIDEILSNPILDSYDIY